MTRFNINTCEASLDSTWVTQKVTEIKRHSAWQDQMDEFDCEQTLRGQVPFTFVLRPGKDAYHYFLSFVDSDYTVVHKPVIIEFSAKGWFYKNGGGHIRENLIDLIPVALHCSPEQCKPYFKQLEALFCDFQFGKV